MSIVFEEEKQDVVMADETAHKKRKEMSEKKKQIGKKSSSLATAVQKANAGAEPTAASGGNHDTILMQGRPEVWDESKRACAEDASIDPDL
jgi:hypothetical protein